MFVSAHVDGEVVLSNLSKTAFGIDRSVLAEAMIPTHQRVYIPDIHLDVIKWH